MRGNKSLFLLIPLVLLVGITLWRKPRPTQTVQFSPPATQAETVPATQPGLELPCVARGSGLIVEKMLSYEGDFWEDGSNEPAVDVAGLVVYNPGSSGIRRAELMVEQGTRKLSFIITYLPPGSRVLVLERFRNAYSSEPMKLCRCVALEAMPWADAMGASVEPNGVRTLSVKNNTDTMLSSVTLRYKRYDPELELYLGGISYQLTVKPLAAGESLQVSPVQYVQGHSRVVLVEGE